MIKIPMMNEIATAVLSNSTSDFDALKSNPKDYLASHLDIQVAEEVELSVAENSDSIIHLALPYYSGLENLEAQPVSAGEIDDVSGGEIIVTLIAVSTAGAIWGTVGYVSDFAANPDKYNEDGTLKK